MTDEKFMNLNKETALRLWTKQFGKRQKALDFAGREIAKAAYNDRNSNYGWNVDHIFPLSRGGKRQTDFLVLKRMRKYLRFKGDRIIMKLLKGRLWMKVGTRMKS